ncbi:hypothetical protein [Paenibacillus sp. CF384]|uniref:hypothetical protein n=1 Tax=Paenibacillus sp. CF384 TaxID=1884382 RepID=UPI000899905F|nr:hypothetical protein [Paenibacillus sp. CF384]SDX89963.1 hypothetical protein SAMN05518855_102745 [Paenibacillus sp. CF384]
MTAHSERNDKRYYKSGELVPADGVYGDAWGSLLPLLAGDLFPTHPKMGASKWSYASTLTSGLPQFRIGKRNNRT